jgi:16S rRNA (adenine1518-N6/adenine1519-N6)-dimethyltransferase
MKTIKAKKSLGQNFLNSKTALIKIIEVSDIKEQDLILEIGPGTGNLTEKLLETKSKVVAVELDPRMKNLLEDRFKDFSNFKIVIADIREYYTLFLKENKTQFKIIANIPYYLSSFLLRMIFDNFPKPEKIILMVQKELAERITLKNSKNNKLAMFVNLFFETKYVSTIKKESFTPVPKVDSAIICLTLKPTDFNKTFITKYEAIISSAFKQPRKIAISNLKHYYSKDIEYIDIFQQLKINLKSRPEDIDFET